MRKFTFLLFLGLHTAFSQSLTLTPNSATNSEVLKLNKVGIGLDHRTTNNIVGVGTYVNSVYGIIQTHTNHPLGFATNNGTVQAILLTNGNFGLGGITTPQYFLDVNGRSRIRHNGNTAGIWFSKTDNVADQGSFFGNINDASAGIWIGNSWRFGVNDAGTVWIPSLAGTGTRSVSADASGNLVISNNNLIAFSAGRQNSLPISSSISVPIIFDIEEFDISNNYNVATGEFTAPVSGIYHFNINITWTDSFSGAHSVYLMKNSQFGYTQLKSAFIPSNTNSNNTDDLSDQLSCTVQLNANEMVRVQVVQNTGNTQYIAPTQYYTYFSGYKVN